MYFAEAHHIQKEPNTHISDPTYRYQARYFDLVAEPSVRPMAKLPAKTDHPSRVLSETTKVKDQHGANANVEGVSLKRWHTALHASPLLLICVLCYMIPAGAPHLSQGNVALGNNRDFNHRVPPSWSPEQEATYSFRAYLTDMTIWMMMTDLQPHQQCASIISRLGGAA